MNEPEILTEVPGTLKRLIRLVVRGFYSLEHAMIIDLLVRNPCMKEDDIVEILKFERKQLRALINTLKTEKFVKTRMKMETDAENKSTRQTYYFINYQVFVNIVKYKLDHIRRKIEMEEMHNTSRASFRCPTCEKTFTDLEVNELFDMMSGTFRCTFCENEVEEDGGASSVQDSRTLLAKFNEQIQPVYDLLQKCDDIKLAPELLEPEPTDLNKIHNRSHSSKTANIDREVWSGDKNRAVNYNLGSNSTVTISMGGENETDKQEAVKKVPVWMSHSTVEGAQEDSRSPAVNEDFKPNHMDTANRSAVNSEIETILYIHEKKGGTQGAALPGQKNESSSSDSEEETPKFSTPSHHSVEEMESEEEDPMVMVAGRKVSLHEVTDEMVTKMSPEEKAEYIRLGRELYQNMYE
ncbi:general transcription factor IIE subunit 1-like [Ostrea edulis]|uniref:general transcription factor IIE subunit 1-like n=1 Tax=Ostrea edulis TaxID=37623 RepID=UPI002094EF64|nr:general transcription factor IIE subunit 1-like [Ostrea edulis]